MNDPVGSSDNRDAARSAVSTDAAVRPATAAESSPATAAVLSSLGLRRAVGLSGFVLPVVLAVGGWSLGVPLQDNISSYYHTPMRDVFVGVLSAMGVFLFCYRGTDWVENWTANIGSVAAIGVAMFPLDPASDPLLQRSVIGYLHTFFGGVLFITFAFYSLYHFPQRRFSIADVAVIPDDQMPPGSVGDTGGAGDAIAANQIERDAVYRTSGLVILASMILMGGYLLLTPPWLKTWLNDYNFLFWMESIATWSFAAAWLTKGRVIVADIAVDLLAEGRHAVVRRIKPIAERHLSFSRVNDDND